MDSKSSNSTQIKQKALELGFSACGITAAKKLENEEERLRSFLDNQYQGEMNYLENHFDKRLDPRLMVENAKSVVVVLMNYLPENIQEDKNAPIVSKYAYGNDYHKIVKDKLFELMQFVNDKIAPVQGRAFVDSAPVLERAWAVEAGLGWIGKNGLLINKELGSFFFIGELIVDLELEYDQPFKKEYCGSCSQCLDACPTGALIKPYVLDARKCISYLTIELKADVHNDLKPLLSDRIFGCDICQDICPWNRKAKAHQIAELKPIKEVLTMNGDDWETLNQDQFNVIFRHSAIKRAGFDKLKQNICNVKKVGDTN